MVDVGDMLLELGQREDGLKQYEASRRIREELADGRLCQLALEELNSSLQVDYYAIRRAAEAPGPVASQLWQQLAALSASWMQVRIRAPVL